MIPRDASGLIEALGFLVLQGFGLCLALLLVVEIVAMRWQYVTRCICILLLGTLASLDRTLVHVV